MKLRKWMLAAGLTAAVILAGCGGSAGKDAGQTQEMEETTQENTAQKDSEQAQDTENSQEEQNPEDAGESESSESAETVTYEDNFAVDSKAAAAFAEKIKEAVAAKDLEALADLTSFPVYVGLPDIDGGVETREDFLALGADSVFTQELMDAVAAADDSSLQPSMAGFVLSNESGRPNIIFGVVDGKLAVTGINY